jgi:hypothetical protein
MTPLLLAIAATVAVSITGAVPLQGSPDPVPAQQPAPGPALTSIAAEVIILHATNDNTGIDPKIGKIPALSKPPFSSYNSYKLLDRATLALEKGKAGTVKLPTGRDLQVRFKDVVEPVKKDEQRRFLVDASIQKPDGKAFLPLIEVNAKAGEWFFVAGQDYKGGGLVIGIKINP